MAEIGRKCDRWRLLTLGDAGGGTAHSAEPLGAYSGRLKFEGRQPSLLNLIVDIRHPDVQGGVTAGLTDKWWLSKSEWS